MSTGLVNNLTGAQLNVVLDTIRAGERLLGRVYTDLNLLRDAVQRRLAALGYDHPTVAQLQSRGELTKLLAFLRREGVRTYERLDRRVKSGLKDMVHFYGDRTIASLSEVLQFKFRGVPSGFVERRVESLLVEGVPMSDWFAAKPAELVTKLGKLAQEGVRRGFTVPDLVTKLRSDPEFDLVAQAKAQAAALVRTSAISALNDANLEAFRENADVIRGVQWVSTLDQRTTPICQALDGLTWDLDLNPIGHGRPYPGPVAHWNCRSTQVPVLRDLAELGLGSGGFTDTTRASAMGQVPVLTPSGFVKPR